MGDMRDILDLERYPLDKPGTAAWDDLVARCRTDLAREGMYNLDGLVRPAALEKALEEVRPRFRRAFVHPEAPSQHLLRERRPRSAVGPSGTPDRRDRQPQRLCRPDHPVGAALDLSVVSFHHVHRGDDGEGIALSHA